MQVKIVIWDLDDTFWKGTLSEGSVELVEDNIYIIKTLVDRGIMNSIVSKNNYDQAMGILHERNLDDYFIFPKISWQPKGQTVKSLLEECGLRAENALFVDDNPSNLEEVKYYNPGIGCISADVFNRGTLEEEQFRGNPDIDHKRLQQYKVLEKRTESKKSYSSNDDFLRSSNIKIEIKNSCLDEMDRVVELVQRTNQMNYTKKRMSKDELTELLKDSSVDCAIVAATDNFGDYGIVGFYAMKGNHLIHFLFSCRVLGFGIENYIWKKLNYPEVDIKGEVTIPLEKSKNVDWIQEDSLQGKTKTENEGHDLREGILFIGGCDLGQAVSYLEMDFCIRKEFNTVINGQEYRTSDTMQLVGAKEFSTSFQNELCDNIPFMSREITYKTELFDNKYKIIVLSLVDDFIRGVYRSKNGYFYITHGAYWSADDDLSKFTKNDLKYLQENFYFDGRETTDEFKTNIEKIISGVGKESKLIFINGIELDVSDWIGADRCERNIEMNKIIDEIIQEHSEIGLVDMRKIVTDRSQCIKQDNRHFDRRCYYVMAQEIIKLSKAYIGSDSIRSKNEFFVNFQMYWKAVKRKANKIIHKIIK